MNKAPTYVVVGCLTMDAVVSANGDLIPRTCGGNALYAAAGASVWSESVGLVARAGANYPAECLRAISAAIDETGVRRLPTDHPLHVAFAYEPDGSRSRQIPARVIDSIPADIRDDFIDNTHDDARYLSGTPTPDEIPATWLPNARGFHVPALLAESGRRLIEAMRRAQPSCLIVTDAPWYSRRDGTIEHEIDVLGDIDAVLPSEEDLAAFRPGAGLLDGARDLIRSGARAAVIKLGAAGSIVVDRDEMVTHVPAYPAVTIDPTGAGDSFCGAFLVGLHETGDLVQAALYGTVAASFVVEQRSAIPVLGVARAAAEARLEALRDKVRVGIESDPRVAAA